MKVKVMHLLSTNKFSGAENVACQIISLTNDTIESIYVSPNGEIQKKLIQLKINYLPINKMNFKNVKIIVDKYNPDIIHAHDIKASIIAGFLYPKKKIISHIHSNMKNMQRLSIKSVLYNYFQKNFYYIIWVSQRALDDYFFNNRIKNKSIVMQNVVNMQEIIKKSNEALNQDFDLIFLGRLEKVKNPLRIIDIIKLIKIYKNDISIAIIGNGSLYEQMKIKITQLNLNNNIIMFGNLDNPYKYLKHSKLMIITSLYEGTPMCILEGMCLGLPIISTPVGELTKIINNNVNGFLCNDNDNFVKNILNLLNDSLLYKELSSNSIKTFKQINNITKYKENLLNIYKGDINNE